MFALWPVEWLNFSNFKLQRLVSRDNARLRKPATSQTQTLCESPAGAHGLEMEELKIFPAPLLTGDSSISICFTVACGQGRGRQFLHRATRHRIATGTKPHSPRLTVLRYLICFWGHPHNKKFMPAAGVVRLCRLFFLILFNHVRQGAASKSAAVINLAVMPQALPASVNGTCNTHNVCVRRRIFR